MIPTILLIHSCCFCELPYKTAATCIKHVHSKHDCQLPSRASSYRRPPDNKYTFTNDEKLDYDEMHHACVSCWFHSADFQELRDHVEQEHDVYIGRPRRQLSGRSKSPKKKSNGNVQFDEDEDVEDEKHQKGRSGNGAARSADMLAKKIIKGVDDLGDMLRVFLKM